MNKFLTFVTLLACQSIHAATIYTFAGTGEKGFSGDGGKATEARLNNPFGLVRGPNNAIYFCEYEGQRIRKITPDGIIHTIAGSGKVGHEDGPAARASFNLPHEIRFARNGDLFVVDMRNHVVRKIDMKKRIVSTIVGTGKAGYSGDGGSATRAQLKMPHSIQFGPDGHLYICDIGNHVIRRVVLKTGIITTYAGTGKPGATPDGSPIKGTPLKGPRSLDFDKEGNLWLATREGNQVFKFDVRKGVIRHIAGTGKKGFSGNNGPALEATLSGPKGIAVAPNGNVYLADTESHSVRMIDARTGRLELIAGTGEKGDGPDGDPLKCQMARLHGIFIDADGSLFIGDSAAHKIRVIRF